MARRIRINAGQTQVALPNGEVYDTTGGEVEVTLTDAEYAKIRPSAFPTILTDLGAIPDVEITDLPSEVATDAEVAAATANLATDAELAAATADMATDAELAAAVIYPRQARVLYVDVPPTTGLQPGGYQGSGATQVIQGTHHLGGIRTESSNLAVGDFFEYEVLLDEGTYRLDLLYSRLSTGAIFQVSVDGVNVGAAQDGYAATTTPTVVSFTGIVIADPGWHTIRITATGKNALSTSFKLTFSALSMLRTGA